MSLATGEDLPGYFPRDLELRLHDSELFGLLHKSAEWNSFFFSIGHRAIEGAAESNVDNQWLVESLSRGVEAYEIVTGAIENRDFNEPDERTMVNVCVREFFEDIRRPEDFILKANYARERMEQDAPLLTEVVHEATSRHVNRDKVAESFALRGAAILRGMHIFVSRRVPVRPDSD